MDLFHYCIAFGAGILAGIMNAIAGGGTMVTFPALLLAGIPSVHANATSTVALIPSALSYTAAYRRNIPAVMKWIRMFALVSLVGGLLGGILLVKTPAKVFDWLVPFLILGATVIFTAHSFFSKLSKREARAANADHSEHPVRWKAGVIFFQFIVSVYGGYFGAGAGILMLATLGMMGIGNIHEMNTVKGILGFLINIVAAIYFAFSGLVHWPAATVMAVGSVIGAYAGGHFAQRVPQIWVRRMVTIIGLTVTVYTFAKQMHR